MDKTISPYRLYEEGEVIDEPEHTVFECARWHSYRSVLMLIIWTITAPNVVGVMIASRENWASVAERGRGADSETEEERSWGYGINDAA